MAKVKHDLTGQKFGRLLVLERSENSRTGKIMWLCQCDCGKTKKVRADSLKKTACTKHRTKGLI